MRVCVRECVHMHSLFCMREPSLNDELLGNWNSIHLMSPDHSRAEGHKDFMLRFLAPWKG